MVFGNIFDWFRSSPDRDAQGRDFHAPWGDRASIHEHIVRHLDPSGRLTPEGQRLPDEPDDASQQVRWAPGALDGAFGHHGNAGENEARAAELHAALARAARKRDPASMRHLHALLSDGHAIDFVDPLIRSILERQDIRPDRLLALALWLATNAPDRESVKIAMALLGLVAEDRARAVLGTLAKHEEFTLYAVVALANTLDEPDVALWELARSVDGWGRIHAIERLQDTRHPDIRAWLLREGYRNSILLEYTALLCAETGGLVEALRAGRPDDALFRGAGQILDTLIRGQGGPAAGIDEFAAGAEAVQLYLGHVAERERTLDLDDLLVVATIGRFLDDARTDGDTRRDRGWTPELRASLRTRCAAVLEDPAWHDRVQDGLRSADQDTFVQASRAAEELGIDAWPEHHDRLAQRPEDAWLWFQVCRTRDPERFRQALAFAAEELPLRDIATGPDTLMGLGPGFAFHAVLDTVLQELRRFPGEGWPLVRTGLASPVVRNRHMALHALGTWGERRWGPEVEPTLRRALAAEPDDDVRKRIEEVLGGDVVEPPGGTG